MKGETYAIETLNTLYEKTEPLSLGDDDRYIIFSDLHMGNGGRADDFRSNAEIFMRVLREYYLNAGYTLILNGDVEELQRFSLDRIKKRWKGVYELFSEFENAGRLYRLVGNHDLELLDYNHHGFDVHDALRFQYEGNNIFIFHGHQTSPAFEKHHRLVSFILRYFATPLKIRNYEVAHNSEKKFRTEKRAYEFASRRKILSIIGHTHRPLFESMSKVDSIKFEIERLCRKYPGVSSEKKQSIERKINQHKEELVHIQHTDEKDGSRASLYRENLVVPCTFNSGCVLGKRGMTALEIDAGELALVHWFDRKRSRKYLNYDSYRAERLGESDYYRVVIKKDSLNYIMTRIKLLA